MTMRRQYFSLADLVVVIGLGDSLEGIAGPLNAIALQCLTGDEGRKGV